jgi:phosphoglucomutase
VSHFVLKKHYLEIFAHEWEIKKNELSSKWGLCAFKVLLYKGLDEYSFPVCCTHVAEEILERFSSGGLKIVFFDDAGKLTAAIWMRGSATEPVFRVMADVSGSTLFHDFMLQWHRQMVADADKK